MTIQPLTPATVVAEPEPDRAPDFSPPSVDGEVNRRTSTVPPADVADLDGDALSIDVEPEEAPLEGDAPTALETQPPATPKPIAPGLRIGLQPGLRPGV